MIMILNKLKEVFIEARNNKHDVYVELSMPNQKETEIIFNWNSSIISKLEYYSKTYDANGVHNNCSNIKIVNVGAINLNCFTKDNFKPITVAIVEVALSKQVSTLVKGITLTDYGLIGVCPCCGACVRTLNDNNNVCGCGQQIDWGNTPRRKNFEL